MFLKMKSKKGDAAAFIVGTMITLIAFFLIAGVLVRFTAKSSDKEAELLCQNSIALRARSAVKIGGTTGFETKLVPPLCRTIDKKVSGTREQMLRQIADKMATCWWMFGEGRYEEILDNVGTKGLLKVLSMESLGRNDCFNCYTILIDEDEIKGGPIKADEINDFLRKEKYSKANTSYLDYIQGHGGPGRVVFTAPQIFPHHAYTISMMPKNKEQSTFWTGAFAGAVVGVLFPPLGIQGIISLGLAGGTQAEAAEAYLTSADYNKSMATAYNERDVSSIYFGFLEVGQEMCGSGDIAGQ